MTGAVVGTVRLRAPSDGYVTVDADMYWTTSNSNGQLNCQLTDGATTIDFARPLVIDTSAVTGSEFSISMHQTFEVDRFASPVAGGQAFNLVCRATGGIPPSATVFDVAMTATFHSTSYQFSDAVLSP